MKKLFKYLPVFFVFAKSQTYAMCPVCTVAAAAWIELSHYLWIDDTVTWIWIWGMLVSISMWTIDWFDRKNIRFLFKRKLTYIFYYATVMIPLYYQKLLLVNPANKIWWIDKLLLGMIVWTILFYGSARYYMYIKAKNSWRAQFPMQKVVMPIVSLWVASLIFYYITSFVYA